MRRDDVVLNGNILTLVLQEQKNNISRLDGKIWKLFKIYEVCDMTNLSIWKIQVPDPRESIGRAGHDPVWDGLGTNMDSKLLTE